MNILKYRITLIFIFPIIKVKRVVRRYSGAIESRKNFKISHNSSPVVTILMLFSRLFVFFSDV